MSKSCLFVCRVEIASIDFSVRVEKGWRMSSPQARPKLSGKHGFQMRGAGDEREARVRLSHKLLGNF